MPASTVIRNLESETILRVSWRLLPFLIAAYLINYIEKNWLNKHGALERWAAFHREVSWQ